METAVPILLFLGFLFGSTLLILILGIQSREREKREVPEEDAAPAFQALGGPRFFASLSPPNEGPAPAFAAVALEQRVADHLTREQELAAGFVLQPTMERLFQGSTPQADVMAAQLERFLQQECKQAAAFVSAPSAERLLDGSTDFIGFVPQASSGRDPGEDPVERGGSQ